MRAGVLCLPLLVSLLLKEVQRSRSEFPHHIGVEDSGFD